MEQRENIKFCVKLKRTLELLKKVDVLIAYPKWVGTYLQMIVTARKFTVAHEHCVLKFFDTNWYYLWFIMTMFYFPNLKFQ